MSLHPPTRPPDRLLDRAPERPADQLRLVHEPDGVRIVLTGPGGAAAATGAVDEAVAEAQAHRARHVLTTVEVSGPLCAPLLQAARDRVGVDAVQVRLRRAGSSVMVDLELLP